VLANADGSYTLYYVPALNAFGLNLEQVALKIVTGQPAQLADAAQLATLLGSFPTSSLQVDVAQVNVPPRVAMLVKDGKSSSTVQDITAQTVEVSVGKQDDGDATKAFSFIPSDVDVGGNSLLVTVSTSVGTLELPETTSESVATNLVVSKTESSWKLQGTVADLTRVLSNTILTISNKQNKDNSAVLTIVVDDQGFSGLPSCNTASGSGVVTGTVAIKLTSASRINTAAVAGAASAAVVAMVAGSAAIAGLAYLALNRSNLLDEAAVPFGEDDSAFVTSSPAYQAGAVGGSNPVDPTYVPRSDI